MVVIICLAPCLALPLEAVPALPEYLLHLCTLFYDFL